MQLSVVPKLVVNVRLSQWSKGDDKVDMRCVLILGRAKKTPKMWIGREVTELHEDGTRHELGEVQQVHWPTWRRREPSKHPHSLTLTHRVHTVLVWSGGRWRNRLHNRARYLVG